MKIVIIEDEKPAATRLKQIIENYEPGCSILKILDSVEDSIKWFDEEQAYELVFMDIQLADGLSFEIFEKTKVSAPVIFTTAFDEYAIKAFKVNSIDYILKPYDEKDIKKALDKYKNISQNQRSKSLDPLLIEKLLLNLEKKYKTRFVIKVGEHIRFISAEEICFFYSMEKNTFLQHTSGKSYGIEYTMDQLEEMLDPATYFRISRKYIVSLTSIIDIVSFTNSRLKLKLKNCTDNEVIVSRERVQDFKSWLEG